MLAVAAHCNGVINQRLRFREGLSPTPHQASRDAAARHRNEQHHSALTPLRNALNKIITRTAVKFSAASVPRSS